MFEEIFKLDPSVECTCHFHNTYGMGMANCHAAMRIGVKYFETSFAGLGGCPFTKVAAGNVCTEDFVHFLQRMGLRTDVNLDKLIEIARDVSKYFGREMPGLVHKSGPLGFVSPHETGNGR
jgi:hydroxymethylglutaryl-CoA lyase